MIRSAPILLATLSLAGAPSLASENEPPPLKGVDVYGTTKFDSVFVEEEFGTELARLANAVVLQDYERSEEIEREITERLEQLGEFEWIDVSIVTYFPPDAAIYITVDVVESQDAASRMPFRAPPESAPTDDPGGLLSEWRKYEAAVHELASAGKLESGDCEVLHCLASFEANPQLLPWLAVFNEGVAAHEEALYRIAKKGANPENRAAALFLLAHTNDVDRLMPVLGDAIYDASHRVRNNAMRVMVIMADDDPDRPFPVADLVAAMDFPATSDRNKATYTVAYLAESPKHRDIIMESAVPTALRLLRMQQPNNHDAAYFLLKNLSGEDFGERDYEEWERWFKTAGAPPSPDR